MRPEKLWYASIALHKRGHTRLARLLKGVCFLLYHCVLPPEAEVGTGLMLEHYGLGVVIHPNTTIKDNVRIYQGVTVAAATWVGSPHRVTIGSGADIGAGAKIIARSDRSLQIGEHAKVGANAVVTRDVPPGAVVVGVPARELIRDADLRTTE